MDNEEEEPLGKLSIAVPPATRRRAERITGLTGRPLAHFFRDLPAKLEAGLLARLSSDEHRAVYLRGRLRWTKAFPDKPEPKAHQFRFPDPPAGEHEPITITLTDSAREMLTRYCRFMHVSKGYVVATHLATVERAILKRFGDDDDKRRRYLAGEIKRPRRPGPPGGEELIIEEPIAAE